MPVLPNYLISQSHGRVVFRNFEGYISTYTEPTDYQRPKRTRWVPAPRSELGQRGVSGLLAGEAMTIQPAHWETRHQPAGANEPALRAPGTNGHDETISLATLLSHRDVEVAGDGDAPGWAKVN